jgi:hypothetical protein
MEKLAGQRIRREHFPVKADGIEGGKEGIKDDRFIAQHSYNWHERLPQKTDKHTIKVFVFS